MRSILRFTRLKLLETFLKEDLWSQRSKIFTPSSMDKCTVFFLEENSASGDG